MDYDVKQGLNRLTISNAQLGDAGDYTVKAKNALGSFRFTVVVAVGKAEERVKPEIIEKTSSILTRQESETTKTSVETREEMMRQDTLTQESVTVNSEEKAIVTKDMSTLKRAECLGTEPDHEAKPSDVRPVDGEEKPKAIRKPWEDSDSESESESEEEGEPPYFVEPPQPLYIDVGEKINFSCRVAGQNYFFDRTNI